MVDDQDVLNQLETTNLAETMTISQRKAIAKQVVDGYEIDLESRSEWLDTNNRAMNIIHQTGEEAGEKNDPFENSARVIYPLLAPAIIAASARIIPNFEKGGVAFNTVIKGLDQDGQIAAKAARIFDYVNWDLLDNSEWMLRNHQLSNILASWGTVFRKTIYDPIDDEVRDELIHPKEVIINNNVQSLEDAPRITIMNYLDQNDIMTQVHLGYFNSDLLDKESELYSHNTLESFSGSTYDTIENNTRDDQPIHEILEQYCKLDLDEDGYFEPYCVYVHKPTLTVLGISPAYDDSSIKLAGTKTVKAIKRNLPLVVFKYFDDPDGGFYGIGLNHLLMNHNKSVTTITRTLLDSGTIANYQGGFFTDDIKTKQRDIKFKKLGEWKRLETRMGTDLGKAFLQIPTKEPSTVLLQMLQLLVESGKELAGTTDILTGDIETQNSAASSILQASEAANRPFKPIIKKLFYSLAKEFKIRFKLYKKLSKEKYNAYFGANGELDPAVDFDTSGMQITPVADPTLSTDAYKFAQANLLKELLPIMPNKEAVLIRLLTTLHIDKLDELLAPPQQPPPPDPKIAIAQMNIQAKQQEMQLKSQIAMATLQAKQQENQGKQQIDAAKLEHAAMDSMVNMKEAQARMVKLKAEAQKASQEPSLQAIQLMQSEHKLENDDERLRILARNAANKSSS